ncbi:MAG: hypothetical protein EPO23_06910 [Xanthobacteraceae bacterium]|nr:MAG: hypothetical protein EPO23_06910 [Xanthobacteraceae bacterium]
MRRQTEAGGALPAGSSRLVRLDPHSLPIRFAARDPRADGGIRHIELNRDRVVLRRSLRGIPMALNIRVPDFHGIGLHLLPGEDGGGPLVMLVLEHRDPSLSVPLMVAPEGHDVAALWRGWSEVLALPCLTCSLDTERGPLVAGAPTPRRRRRNAIRKRRPSILMRRRPGEAAAIRPVHRGEREIIARD